MIKRIGKLVMIQLSGNDSNIYVAGDKVVDAGTGFNFTRMYDLFKVLNIDPKVQIKEVINTHCHFDHVGGNGYFFEAKIAVHKLDAAVVETGDMEGSVADYFDGNLRPRVVGTKLTEGDVIELGGDAFEVIHTPGHTPGSICLYNRKDKVLISGDTIFATGIGRTDFPGGNPVELKKSLEKLAGLDVEVLLPGHGNPVPAKAKSVIKSAADEADFM